jgi:hypothetical protein
MESPDGISSLERLVPGLLNDLLEPRQLHQIKFKSEPSELTH